MDVLSSSFDLLFLVTVSVQLDVMLHYLISIPLSYPTAPGVLSALPGLILSQLRVLHPEHLCLDLIL
jgi:hypothetical protein